MWDLCIPYIPWPLIYPSHLSTNDIFIFAEFLTRNLAWKRIAAILYQFIGWSFIVCIFHVPWNPKPQALSLAVQIVFILSPSLSYIPPLQPGKFLWTVAIYPVFFWENPWHSMSLAGISTLCFFWSFFRSEVRSGWRRYRWLWRVTWVQRIEVDLA